MKVITLVENTSGCDYLSSEHGLSVYLEFNGKRILFDMGQSRLFSENARMLGVDLSEVDVAVLSHGHYDHGGGLGEFLKINNKAKVYLSSYAFEEHYNGKEKYIGLEKALMNSERLCFVDDVMDLFDGVKLYSAKQVEKKSGFSAFGLTVKKDGVLLEDDFRHEIYLEIKEGAKRILFSGCSHNGIVDIMDAFKPSTLIGGFHFSKIDREEELKSLARRLGKYDTDYYTCHCTGREQYLIMKKYLPRLEYLSTGDEIQI